MCAVAGGLGTVVALFLPYLVIGGEAVSPPRGVADVLAAVVWPATVIAAGASVVLGRLPRLGLAAVAASGGLAVGRALLEIYQLGDEQSRPGMEAFFGQWLLTSSIEPASGARVSLAAYLLLGLALLLTLLAWPQTVMEDTDDFDPLRPLTTGAGAMAGFVGMLALAAQPTDIPDRVVTGPGGFELVMPSDGPLSLLDRTGVGLAGALVLSGAVLALAVIAATLRPRLGTVGVFGALAGYFISSAVGTALDAGRSPELELALGGVLQIVAALAFTALTGWALRARAATPASGPAGPRGLPAR